MFESLINGIIQAVSEVIWMLWIWIGIMCALIGAIIGRFIANIFLKGYPSEFTWATMILFGYIGYKSALLISVSVPLTIVGIILLAIFTPIGAYLGALISGITPIAKEAGTVVLVEQIRRKMS